MAILNFMLARTLPFQSTLVSYTASQHLMDVLIKNRFVEIPNMPGTKPSNGQYSFGQVYYFRRHGQCTINFLKDGRVHVLSGPISLWNLHDSLSTEELTILIAFAKLSDEQQEVMRNYMGPRCRRYTDVLHQMPAFNVDWKRDFLEIFGRGI